MERAGLDRAGVGTQKIRGGFSEYLRKIYWRSSRRLAIFQNVLGMVSRSDANEAERVVGEAAARIILEIAAAGFDESRPSQA